MILKTMERGPGPGVLKALMTALAWRSLHNRSGRCASTASQRLLRLAGVVAICLLGVWSATNGSGGPSLVATAKAQEAQPAAADPPAQPPSATKPPAAASPPPPGAGIGAALSASDPSDLRLRALEEKVLDLKEKVYRSKSRMMLLREQVLHNVIAEANAVIVHTNDMGSTFDLEQVVYYLDGERIFFRDNRDGELSKVRRIDVYNASVAPGSHILSVELLYRGSGGVFTYVDGYSFRVRSNFTFKAEKGRITRVEGIGYERGGVTTDIQDKPFVRFDVKQFQYSRENIERLSRGETPPSAGELVEP